MKFYKTRWIIAIGFVAFVTSRSCAENTSLALEKDCQRTLNEHFQKYKESEYFSGASLSIYIPHDRIQNFYIGKVSHEDNSAPVSSNTLFQIGSITKSFTAAMMLQLEKEGKINLSQTIGLWFPEYKKWSSVNLTQLLNMTSGLPNYSDNPLWITSEFKNPQYNWSPSELIKFSYPEKFNPPLRPGYFYSNTGYVLSQLIIEKNTKNSFQNEMINRLIKHADLQNTFYPLPNLDVAIQNRLAHGYNFNQYDNPASVGRDMYNASLSWAGPAGAIIATTEDVIKWVKALFIEFSILDAWQKQKLMSLVSTHTGKPLQETSVDEPNGFGLGVIQAYNENMGRYWFYEGVTLGFRTLYMYKPCNDVIISVAFNSAINSENDHAGELVQNIYSTLLKNKPELVCKENVK